MITFLDFSQKYIHKLNAASHFVLRNDGQLLKEGLHNENFMMKQDITPSCTSDPLLLMSRARRSP